MYIESMLPMNIEQFTTDTAYLNMIVVKLLKNVLLVNTGLWTSNSLTKDHIRLKKIIELQSTNSVTKYLEKREVWTMKPYKNFYALWDSMVFLVNPHSTLRTANF